MKRDLRVFFTVSSLILGGCGVVPIMGPAFVAMSSYQFNKTGEIDFRIKRNDPDASSLQVILRAKTLAIYPSREGSDGDGIDLMRQNTDFAVISSTKTIEWVEKNKALALKSMPATERTETVARMARSVGADLGLFAMVSEVDSEVTGVVVKNPLIKLNFTTHIVDAKTAKTLWVEDQQLFIEVSGGKSPGAKELNAVATKGIAQRLMDLRLGRNPTAAKAT